MGLGPGQRGGSRDASGENKLHCDSHPEGRSGRRGRLLDVFAYRKDSQWGQPLADPFGFQQWNWHLENCTLHTSV